MANKEKRPVQEEWLSLEQTADTLGVPREDVRRWARDGDPRVPAYQVWDEDNGNRGRFRFKKSDVEAFQALTQAQDPAPDPS
jgi:excisionase family DNA binding protein